ncbi:SDR family NAD(P)-dependent oxidoreductase [Streptomyces sp. SID12488]|nr:SDR family NAD(P)-dependent oxidoreductase [Streptomyces sp. SID12488]NEA63536.1 SDR family NAD(P)-dependent oxidoreductase [Streptomyces sp. SID12488]
MTLTSARPARRFGHVIVTGGSSGIGLATARLLAERGARISLIARARARERWHGSVACCCCRCSTGSSTAGPGRSAGRGNGPEASVRTGVSRGAIPGVPYRPRSYGAVTTWAWGCRAVRPCS